MDDTRERFLTAIVGRLGAERIVEVHLFSPIRQGVMETGVAVVAALPEALLRAEEEAGRSAEEESGRSDAEGLGGDGDEVIAAEDASAPAADEPAAAAFEGASAPPTPDSTVPAPVPARPDSEPRHVVFTAGYRLTRKGPDRGKWAFEMDATADAPLATVDTVVRGVLQRSKDLTETERLSGEQLRAVLAEPAWRTAP